MQNAKDTFYELLRNRLAAVNPERTVVLRGVTRPAVIVTENELLSSAVLPDCFHLRWMGATVTNGALPLAALTCEIGYETAGTNAGGMDRGRTLAAMDAELLFSLTMAPCTTAKQNHSALANGGTVTDMQTNIWWGPPEFSGATSKNDRLQRTVRVAVMSYQEAGEL
jgi:hypothetical protein